MCWTCKQGFGKAKEGLQQQQQALELLLNRSCRSGPRAWSSFTAMHSCCCCRAWPSLSWGLRACPDRGVHVKRLYTRGSAWLPSISSLLRWGAQACCGTRTLACPPFSWGRTCWLWLWSWAQPGRDTSRSARLQNLEPQQPQKQGTQTGQAKAWGKRRVRPRGKRLPQIITQCPAPKATLFLTSAWSQRRHP